MILEKLNMYPENILKLLPLSLPPAMALASCFPQSSAMHWVVVGWGRTNHVFRPSLWIGMSPLLHTKVGV